MSRRFARFEALPGPDPYLPAGAFAPETLVEPRDTNQSHLRMIYRPDVDVADERQRAALAIYSTLLGGSMGSRLFEEIREKRGLCYSVYAINHAFADVPILQLGSGLESDKCVEAYGGCARSSTNCAGRADRRGGRPAPAPTRPGGCVLAFENSGAVARHAATQQIVFGRGHRPRRRDRGARRGHLRRGRRSRRPAVAVACVGRRRVGPGVGQCCDAGRRARAEAARRLADRDHAVDRHAGPLGEVVGGTRTSKRMRASESRSLGSVIIFM